MTNVGNNVRFLQAGFIAFGIAALISMSTSPAPVHAQTPGAPQVTCKHPQYDWIQKQLPAGARIELLVAAGNTIPEQSWPTYREAAIAVLACAGDGSTIELLPITNSGASVAPVFVGSAPTPDPDRKNPLLARLEKNAFVTHILSALDSLHPSTTSSERGFDPLGALAIAGDSLHRIEGNGKSIVVVIGNGWQQNDVVDLFRYHDNPANRADDVVRRLKSDGTLPNLAGTDVFMAGITRGDRHLKISTTQLRGLCRFWETVIQAGNGKLRWCGAVLPGMMVPLSRNDDGRRSQALAQVLR